MLKIKNIIFFCGVLVATLSSVEPIAWASKKPLVTQVAPEEAQKKAFWQRRKKRKKFRLSKKTAAKIALALGITYVGIKLLSKAKLSEMKRTTTAGLAGTDAAAKADEIMAERKKRVLANPDLRRRLDEYSSSDKKDVHFRKNVQTMLEGFDSLKDIQAGIHINFDTEVTDLLTYLKSSECLKGASDRNEILQRAKITLGLEKIPFSAFGDFFSEQTRFKDQFGIREGAELLARTWHFIKNYIDPVTGKPEVGLKDTMIRSLAEGTVDGRLLCFTGKVYPICSGIWAGRVFIERSEVNPDHFISNKVANDFKKLSEHKSIDASFVTEIVDALKNKIIEPAHLIKYANDMIRVIELTYEDDQPALYKKLIADFKLKITEPLGTPGVLPNTVFAARIIKEIQNIGLD